MKCAMDLSQFNTPDDLFPMPNICQGEIKQRYLGTNGKSIYFAALCDFHND